MLHYCFEWQLLVPLLQNLIKLIMDKKLHEALLAFIAGVKRLKGRYHEEVMLADIKLEAMSP